MAHALKALVGESSITTGTGSLTLAGALVDHRRVSSAYSVSDTFEYRARHVTNGTWETGIGTYSATNTMARTTVEDGSSGTSKVNFAAGGLEVVVTPLASRVAAIPRGGSTNQGLRKSSGVDHALAWIDYFILGGALGTPASGNLSNCTADGTNKVGTLGVAQIDITANTTLTLTARGKHVRHSSATAHAVTIPANASVAYAIGDAITFVNPNGSGVLTIAITTDTMRLAGAGTTGSRTLAANGIATALKVSATEWIISGTGLT